MIKFLAKLLQEIHFAQIVLGKFTFIITVVNFIVLISLKWKFDPTQYIIILGFSSVILMWFMGWLLEKTGIRKHFQQRQVEGVKFELKEK